MEKDILGPAVVFDNENNPTIFQLFADDFILMQYTGLKDKNGKEIYEGDIVTSGHTNVIEGVVTYRAPEFIIKMPRGKMWGAFMLRADQNQFQEVIGNIYENKELLNG